jgi:small-conductance mechanosensitive channel
VICSVVFVLLLVAARPEVVLAQSPQVDSNAILNHLNLAISWYQHVSALDASAGQPSDALYLESARNSATQALQFAFQSAQAEAALIQSQKAGSTASAGTNGEQNAELSNVEKAAADTAARIKQAQSELEALNQQIEKSSGKKRQTLVSQRDALQGQLDLDRALADALGKIASFVGSNENVKSGLLGKINDLRRSIPQLVATPADEKSKTSNPQQTSKAARADSSGLIGQTAILFSQMGDVHEIDQLMRETLRLRSTAEQLQAPLRDALRSTLQRGRDAASRPPTADPAQLETIRRDLELLTAQFKQISAAAVPLRQEMILLDQCHADLQEWRNSIAKQYAQVLRSLLLRICSIIIALVVVAIISALWRRAAYRYIRDPRRRRQLLLVRRFVTGFLMAVVVAMGFISEFSSLATFAGFLTAGIAVALQTVILSIAAYFFLIGRYGVRAGDRITVSGVTGDVIDVGLVRLYMMELAGTGIDLYPTGRVVVFSNSVLFQATPLYKQIPGTSYTWHEIALTFAAGADSADAEKELVQAVNEVYADYRPSIEQQYRTVAQLVDTYMAPPEPHSKLRFSDAGLEFVIRYPVEIHRAAEIDERVTRRVMEVMASHSELQQAVPALPRLRSPIKA